MIIYITHNEGKSRLNAVIKRSDMKESFVLFYEVEEKYGEYLCFERSDSFLLGLLSYSMLFNYDIECKVPVSEQLYYQLTHYYIPIVSENINRYHSTSINAPLTNESISSGYAVGTGFSGGVDSFYTILKHQNLSCNSFCLTHLLFANVGALTHITERASEIFEKKVHSFMPIANELHLPLVSVNTNYLDFFGSENIKKTGGADALKVCSCVYSLRKLFHTYYFASSFELNRFSFSNIDTGFYDLFNLKEFSLQELRLYSSGTEATRMKKLEYIVDNSIVQESLTVCASFNCNRCNKCIRTMMELYVLNKLDLYDKVFDIKDFKKNFRKRIAFNFANKTEWVEGFNKEIVKMAKRNNIHIPFSAYLLSLVYRPLFSLKTYFCENRFLRKLYYKLNLDVLLYGPSAVYIRTKDL